MTLKDIKVSVEQIHNLIGEDFGESCDAEAARSEENRLYRAFIQEIVAYGSNCFGCPLEEAAKEVLKTREIPFSRMTLMTL